MGYPNSSLLLTGASAPTNILTYMVQKYPYRDALFSPKQTYWVWVGNVYCTDFSITYCSVSSQAFLKEYCQKSTNLKPLKSCLDLSNK